MKNSLVKESIIYSIGSFLIKAFGFFLIPIYTRFLSIEEYGILALLMVMLQLVSFIFLLGISSASMRYYFNPNVDENYRRKLYGNAFILLLIFPPLLFVLFSLFGNFVIKRFLPSIPFFPYVFVILIIGLLKPIQKLVLGLLRVQKRSKNYISYTISFFLLQTVTIIIAVTLLKFGLKGIIYAQLFANLIYWLIAISILRRNSKFDLSITIVKKLFLFGIPLIPFFIFAWINNASGRFMLERYVSLRDLGIFALAAQFSGLLFFLSDALDNAILPYFYETAQGTHGVNAIGRFATKYFVFFGLVSLITLVIAKPLILIMADPKFHQAVNYIPILILAGWVNIIYKIFQWSLMYSKKTGLISSIAGISAFLMVCFLFISFNYWNLGIWGVIYVMLLVGVFKILFGYFASQKQYKINFNITEIGLTFLVMLASAIVIDRTPFEINSKFVLWAFVKVAVFLIALVSTIRIAKIKTYKNLASIKAW